MRPRPPRRPDLPKAGGSLSLLAVASDAEVACPGCLDLAWWDLRVFVPFDPGPVPGAWDEEALIGTFCVVDARMV